MKKAILPESCGPGISEAMHSQDARFDPDAMMRREYAKLVAGHYKRMPPNYRIVRPIGTQDWLVISTIAGAGVIRGKNTSITVGANQIVLFKPHEPHDYGTHPQSRYWSFYWAHFQPPPSVLPLLIWPESPAGGLFLNLPCGSGVSRRIASGFREMYSHATGLHPRREWLAANALEGVLLHCETLVSQAGGVGDARLTALIHFIDKKFSSSMTLEDLSMQAGLSVSRLSTLFRGHLQISPQAYIEKRRLEEALRLLYSESLTIKEVATLAGFEDPLYFSRRFKKHFGICPESYRKERLNRVTLEQ